jgi:hypothetical protein
LYAFFLQIKLPCAKIQSCECRFGAIRFIAAMGTLNAIDLNTGQYLWKIPLGETSLPNQKKCSKTTK